MEVWKEKVQQDISELKNNQTHTKNEITQIRENIAALQMNDKLQDKEISTIKESLGEIKEDTSWIRRKITGALITALITAVVAGVVGVAIANIF